MSKALVGVSELGAAVGMGALAMMDPALVASPLYDKIWLGVAIGGVSSLVGAAADALVAQRGMNIATRQPASFRQIVYGTQRVGDVTVYRSTTGSHYDQYNYVIVLATHVIDSIEALYLDGRKVYFETGSGGNSTRNGVNFGGSADGNTYIGPNGQHYNFGSLVYAEARYGDQADGDVISGLTANDSNWAASSSGSPYLGGCAYIYLKAQYDSSMFPQEPEIRLTVNGKNDIYDPRTGTTGFSSNWALCVADAITDPAWGLGDASVNQDQLIAAANVCDEQVDLAAGGTEARYSLHWHYDTSTAPGDVLNTMMANAAGRLSRVGGEWFIYPAYWQGPTFTFNENALVGQMSWVPKRSVTDLINRVTGTYIAPNYPYNAAGNLYDSNGWYDGSIQNNFPFAFQPTNYPEFACDQLHGFGTGVDVYLTEDGGVPHPREIAQPTCLSVAQAQRVASIFLLRNRQQGSGLFPMSLSAWQMEPTDVMQFNMASQNWVNKYLEIASTRFRTRVVNGDNDQPVRQLYVECAVQETDPSVYEWSIGEELSVYDVPAAPGAVPYIVDPPTNLTIEDDQTTAVTLQDGTTMPRVLVSWTPPEDVYVANGGSIQVQYQLTTGSGQPEPITLFQGVNGPITRNPDGTYTTPWIDAGSVSGISTYMFVNGISTSQFAEMAVQIRAVRSSGASSAWVEVSNHPLRIITPRFPIGGSGGPSFVFMDTGTELADVEPAEAGANVTETRVARDAANLNGVASHLISPISGLMPATSGSYGTGTDIISNPEFANGTSGWSSYQDSNGAGTTISLVSVSNAPNSTGKVLQITPNGGQVAGGFPHGAGCYYGPMGVATAGTFAMNQAIAGHTYTITIWANIPTNLALQPAYDGAWTWSPVTEFVNVAAGVVMPGTGTWSKYVFTMVAPGSGDFGHLVCYTIDGGVDSSSGWQLASYSVVDLNTQGNTLDYTGDGVTYSRMPGSNMDGNRRALIDFSQTHVNKTLDYVPNGNANFSVSAASGASESIVPNGNFALGNIDGWFLCETGGSGSAGFGFALVNGSTGAGGIAVNGGGFTGVGSATFRVIPGQKYRIIYNVWAASGTQDAYLRINYAGTYQAQITNSNRTGSVDFISGGSVNPGDVTSLYAYDWTCPSGINYASVAVYEWNGATAQIEVGGISVIPYSAAGEWGADVTGQNTSLQASNLNNQSLDTLPDGNTYQRPLYIQDGVYRTSKGLTQQGSLANVSEGSDGSIASYTANNSSITISWIAFDIYAPDGTTYSVSTGSVTFPSLSATTEYYFGSWYYIAGGSFNIANNGTNPITLQQQIQSYQGDGNIAVCLNFTCSTTGSSGSSGGSGVGGPSGGSPATCFSPNTLVRVRRSGADLTIPIADVTPGDLVSTLTGEWRQVFYVTSRVYTGPMQIIPEVGLSTPTHQMWDGSAWVDAQRLYLSSVEYHGTIHNLHIDTQVEAEHSYTLANGQIVHNVLTSY